MLESPLKKSKPSYPIDFSIKKKQTLNNYIKKYDMNQPEQNPQILSQKNDSIFSKKYSRTQIPIESNKKPKQRINEDKQDKIETKNNQTNKNLNQDKQKWIFNKQMQLQDLDEPLKQVKRKNQRIIVDQNKLKNPRIQMNQQKTINKTQRTLQTQSPINQIKKSQKITQIGGIRRQDLKILQKYQDQKQIPLLPQQPFDLMHKNYKTNSLLSKLKLNKMNQNYSNQHNNINPNYQYNIDSSRIYSGSKFFRPQTYTYSNYVNKIISNNQNSNNQNKSNQQQNQPTPTKRSKSSFDMQPNLKKQKIIYMNKGNNDSFSFNLPNLSFDNNDNNMKFKKSNTSNNFTLNSKFANKQIIDRLTPSQNKLLSNFKNQQNQMKSKFQPNQISKIKAQINLIVKNRFKNKQDIQQINNYTERQFTFHQGQQNKNNSFSQNKKKLSNSHQFINKKRLQITYHVPLVQLKLICKKYLSDSQSYRIAFKVPKIFMEQSLFTRTQPKNQLHQNSLILFLSLKISSKNLIVKRYSNCIIFTAGHIAVIWYYNGKRYLGGWQYQYLDQGSRHGLGLEWQPNSYIYYGEFRNNKRYGLGALKQGPEQILVGYWSNQKYIGTNFRQQEEGLESQNQEQQQPQQAFFNRNYQNQDSDLQYRE